VPKGQSSPTPQASTEEKEWKSAEKEPPLDDAAAKNNGTTRATEMSYRPLTPPDGHMIYQHRISTRLFCFPK
jgi:hypothetical protein